MSDVPGNMDSASIASRDARGAIYVGLASLMHILIWTAFPPAVALALSAALVLIEPRR